MNFKSCTTSILLISSLFGASNYTHGEPLFHSPKNLQPQAPLLVVLHGCKQTANDIMEVSGFNKIADREGFAVLYPEQKKTNNLLRCWNWFDQDNHSPQGPEPQALAQLIYNTISQHNLSSKNVFITGLSAGAGMSGIMITYYPQMIKAAALHSGPSFFRANSLRSAVKLMKNGPKDNPVLVNAPFPRKPVLAIQGQKDKTVHPSNVEAIASDLSVHPGFQKIVLAELGHEWSGGKEGYKYSNPNTLSASEEIWSFFNQLIR